MKESDANDDSSLPLRKADIEFAEYVQTYCPVPYDLLYLLILKFKHTVSNPFDLIDKTMGNRKSKALRKKAIILNDTIKSVLIKSERGSLIIDRSDDHFKYFLVTIDILRNKYKKFLPNSVEIDRECLLDGDIFYLNNILETKTKLSEFPRQVVIGLFLVYFEVIKRKHLYSSEEWSNISDSNKDYKHYLAKIAKSRLKAIHKRFKV
jgi:hypothetical protein